MRRKVSTILDETLYRRAKIESIRQGKPVSEIVGEALGVYLDEKRSPRGVGGVVESTWGSLKIDRRTLHRILSEEGDFLDT